MEGHAYLLARYKGLAAGLTDLSSPEKEHTCCAHREPTRPPLPPCPPPPLPACLSPPLPVCPLLPCPADACSDPTNAVAIADTQDASGHSAGSPRHSTEHVPLADAFVPLATDASADSANAERTPAPVQLAGDAPIGGTQDDGAAKPRDGAECGSAASERLLNEVTALLRQVATPPGAMPSPRPMLLDEFSQSSSTLGQDRSASVEERSTSGQDDDQRHVQIVDFVNQFFEDESTSDHDRSTSDRLTSGEDPTASGAERTTASADDPTTTVGEGPTTYGPDRSTSGQDRTASSEDRSTSGQDRGVSLSSSPIAGQNLPGSVNRARPLNTAAEIRTFVRMMASAIFPECYSKLRAQLRQSGECEGETDEALEFARLYFKSQSIMQYSDVASRITNLDINGRSYSGVPAVGRSRASRIERCLLRYAYGLSPSSTANIAACVLVYNRGLQHNESGIFTHSCIVLQVCQHFGVALGVLGLHSSYHFSAVHPTMHRIL